MAYVTEQLLVVILSALFTFSEAQYVEIPSDMRYPCQMGGQYQLPVEEFEFSDYRLKRQETPSLAERIESLRNMCAADLSIPEENIPEDLLNCDNPSPKIKCLMTCILQRLQLMTKKNLISVRGIERVANEIGNYNPLVTSIAVALAQQFNLRLSLMKVTDQCEAGYLINEFIAKEMRSRNMNIN